MQTLFLFVVLFCSVWGQIERVSDPGFQSLAENQCSTSSAWWFRADYLWNSTNDFVDAQCQMFLELPTDARSGITKGNETNINHFIIPNIPTVEGGIPGFPASAAVLDLNSPCRSSLWAPLEIGNDNATLTLSYGIWVTRLSDSITQFFIDNSLVPNATELQYLNDPDGLLQQDNNIFPPEEDIVNQIRVDLIMPDSDMSYYDGAFSLDPSVVSVNFPIPSFGEDNAIPSNGTNSVWMWVNQTVTIPDHGSYALRFASAHSVIGVAWGVSDVHLVESGGTPPANNTVITFPWDMLIENAEQTVGGTLTVYKMPLPEGTVRKASIHQY